MKGETWGWLAPNFVINGHLSFLLAFYRNRSKILMPTILIVSCLAYSLQFSSSLLSSQSSCPSHLNLTGRHSADVEQRKNPVSQAEGKMIFQNTHHETCTTCCRPTVEHSKYYCTIQIFNAELLAKSSQSVKTFLPKKFKSSESFTSYQVLIRLALQSVFVASMKWLGVMGSYNRSRTVYVEKICQLFQVCRFIILLNLSQS